MKAEQILEQFFKDNKAAMVERLEVELAEVEEKKLVLKCDTCKKDYDTCQYFRNDCKHLEPKAEPELRIGAYGYFQDQLASVRQQGFVIFGFDGSDVLIRQSNRAGQSRMGKKYFQQHVIAFLGNIFDDLKAQGEELTYFRLTHKTGETCLPATSVRLLENGAIKFRFLSAESTYCLSQLERLHRKLGQLIATAKKQNKK